MMINWFKIDRFKWVGLILFIILACQSEKTVEITTQPTNSFEPMFSVVEPDTSHISFENKIIENEQFNILQYEYLYNGGGVSIGDINNDGLEDIYLVGNMSQDRLYLNKGDFVFEDITTASGIDGQRGFKTGVNMVDVNQDGFLDIYVCRSALASPEIRANLLYINNGDLTFSEQASTFGLDDKGYSVQAYFFDADLDGDLDAYVLNHPENMRNANNVNVRRNESGDYEMVRLDDYDFISDRYYINNNGKYEDISDKAGILDNAFGLSAVVSDFNGDHLPDIYVANDYSKPDRLWVNQGNHTYKDELLDYFKHMSFSSMGSDYSDMNNDLKPDLMVLDMMAAESNRRHVLNFNQNRKKFDQMNKLGFGKQIARNVFQINDQPNSFSEIAMMDGLGTTDWSWSVLMADFDNDTQKDIHITNGFYRNITNLDYIDYDVNKLQADYKSGKITAKQWLEQIPSKVTRNFFFKNNGDLQFENASDKWGAQEAFSNGSAYGDLDNDGDLDLVVNNINKPASILKNNARNTSNFISVQLKNQANRSTYNSKVVAYLSNGDELLEVFNPQRGFLSSSQHRIHFGLGKSGIDSLKIIWPDQSVQMVYQPKPNELLTVERAKGLSKTSKTPYSKRESVTNLFDAHKENTYNEFDYERLIDKSYSNLGPASLVFDYNLDGLDDVFIGGSGGYAGTLYKQSKNGNLNPVSVEAFETDKNFEDVAIAMIDANQDEYPDLIITSASNENVLSPNFYPIRLYVYSKAIKSYERIAFPEVAVSSSSILVSDLDMDGYDDVIVAGRNYPKYYPEIPKTYVFKQTANGFVDYTENWLPNPYIGMITDMTSVDLDKDGNQEIVVVGEWFSPQIFTFENGLNNISFSYNLKNFSGLWESISVADVNNDGYDDIILGNRGLNNLYKASPKAPLKLIYGDIANTNTKSYLTFYNENKKYVPLLGLKRISSEIPALRKQFNTYESFAKKDWSDLLSRDDIKTFEAHELSHHLLLNNGKNQFKKIPLPHFTQNSIVNAIIPFNYNSNTYYYLAGNQLETDAEFSIYNASNGHVITWDSNDQKFKRISGTRFNFNASKDVRNLHILKRSEEDYMLIINNNDKHELQKITD